MSVTLVALNLAHLPIARRKLDFDFTALRVAAFDLPFFIVLEVDLAKRDDTIRLGCA